MSESRDEQSEAFLNSDTIGDDFFNSIVERKLNIPKEKFKVRLVLMSPATGKNENFISVVYRAKIKVEILETGERETVDVIIKALLTTFEELKKFSVFPREQFMYEDIVLNFENIWLEKAKEIVQFGPKCVKIETDPYEIIVLDDLKAQGYEMMDRRVGLTVAQTKLALTKLAKFHAASAIRYQKDGTIQSFLDRKSSITSEMLSQDSPMGKSFLTIHRSYIECLRSYEDVDVYADKIAAWDANKLIKSWVSVAEPMKCGLTVLTHGDFWLNNMMFKTNESNEPEDVLMLDFQGSAWASPTLDLHYFITSSVGDDFKVEFYDEFIKHYYDIFVESLRKLKYDQHIPSLDELYEDLLSKSEMAAMSAFFIMFVTKYESSEEINMETFMTDAKKDKEFYERIYCNESYKKAIKIWLPFLHERGYLDSLLSDDKKFNGHTVVGS